ncbi:IncI1-type conjugal transfer protein TrbA [Escherichia coli]|nr:IncI1-type conjugal transfer protein TrbA [Escherichia coli]
MSYQHSPTTEDPMNIWYIVGTICLLFAFLIWLFLPDIVFATCLILHTMWGMTDWGPFHHFAAPRYNLLANTANNAATITFSQWLDVMSQTVGILWLILLPMTLGFLWMWFQHPAQPRFTRRPLNIHTLPHLFSSLSPAIAPVLADGDSNRLFHGQKRPERRVALTPEVFVAQNNLIRNMQLDVAATRQCFMEQLGQPLTTWKDMAPHEKALFAVFGLQFFLGDRKSAVSLMNNLNLSCRLKSKRDQGRFSTPVYSLARNAFIRVIKTEDAQQWLRQHRYVRSGLVWLYAHDLRLTPPNWLWLKGVDRTLFYALHRANTTKGFIEGAGVVAVARAENEASRLGLPCPEPCVEEAIEGLRRDMLGLGLIWDEPQPDRDRRRQIRTRWSLTDDVIPRRHDNDEDTDTGETTETTEKQHPADKEKEQ